MPGSGDRFRAGHPATVVFAQAALTGLCLAAVQSLAAHELAHLIRRGHGRPRRFARLLGYLVLVLAGAGLTVTALAAAPLLAGPVLLPRWRLRGPAAGASGLRSRRAGRC